MSVVDVKSLKLPNGSSVIHLESCSSTMDEARARAIDGAPHLTTVWAETQTAGRGRQGRSWQSQAGYGLYFTVIVHINLEPERYGLIPLLVGAILCSSVRDLTGVQASLKWPNDLLAADGRKLAGILIEHDVKSSVFLIGIGLNVRQQPFDVPAASLEEFCEPVDRVALLLEVLARLSDELASLEVGAERTLELWTASQGTLGQVVTITQMDGSSFEGSALEIAPNGSLRVETANGIREVFSGEVSLRFTPTLSPADPVTLQTL
jgi:BirA family transcriptional regulator, biotin operon repressor / biotin---[acetyl-CoA-carboxylase] ligase